MLYEVREANGKVKLLFSKKKGLKFKKQWEKRFFDRGSVDYFVEEYLCHCCLACRQKGWVYKTRLPKSLRSSLRGGGKGVPPVDTLTSCPECQTRHRVQHEDYEIPQYDGSIDIAQRVVLTLDVD